VFFSGFFKYFQAKCPCGVLAIECPFLQCICVHVPHMEFRRLHLGISWRVRYVFPEDRIVLGLITGLKVVCLRCFSRIRLKDSPNIVVYGKITLDINSENLLYCFFLFWIIHFGSQFNMRVRFTYFISLFKSWAVEESFLARSKRVLTTDCFCCIGCSGLQLMYCIYPNGLVYDRH